LNWEKSSNVFFRYEKASRLTNRSIQHVKGLFLFVNLHPGSNRLVDQLANEQELRHFESHEDHSKGHHDNILVGLLFKHESYTHRFIHL